MLPGPWPQKLTRKGVRMHHGPEVIQVPGEPVHAVHDQGVPVTNEAHQLIELGKLKLSRAGPCPGCGCGCGFG
jgi:hypothetical protein